MEKKEEIRKQCEILDDFFANYYDKVGGPFGYWLATGVMLFCSCIFMAIPFQELVQEETVLFWMALLPCVTTVFMYIAQYRNYMEGGIQKGIIDEKLQYLPISAKAFRHFRVCKLIRFLFKVYIVFQVVQILFSLIFFKELVLGNFWYPFLWVFAIPILVGNMLCSVEWKIHKLGNVLLIIIIILGTTNLYPYTTIVTHSIEGVELARDDEKPGQKVTVTVEGKYVNYVMNLFKDDTFEGKITISSHSVIQSGDCFMFPVTLSDEFYGGIFLENGVTMGNLMYGNRNDFVYIATIFHKNAFTEGVIFTEEDKVIVFPASDDKQAKRLLEDILSEEILGVMWE